MPLRASARSAVTCAVACLVMLSGCDDDSSPTPAHALASASSSAHAVDTYVALGDSYTAAPLVPDTEMSSGCYRSSRSYPHLVATALGAKLTDVSCSGASTRSLAPQLAALTADTSLVTLGIGGNDFGVFQTMVHTCTTLARTDRAGSPCRARMSAGGQDLLLAKVARIQGRVAAALEEIRRRSPDATVVLVGYPQPVPAHGTCSSLPLATGDYRYVRSVSAHLNAALRSAAEGGGATFVDLLAASRGHDICAAKAWVNGSITDLTRAAAYHPFASEQRAVAKLIEKALDQ